METKDEINKDKIKEIKPKTKSTTKKKKGTTAKKKISTAKKKAVPKKADVKKKPTKQASTKKTTEMKTKKAPKKQKEFWSESRENIEAGAKIVGEKTSEFTETLFNKLKEKSISAFKSGSKIVDGISHTAIEYTERYKDKGEIYRLSKEKKKIALELGMDVYLFYKDNSSSEIDPINEKVIVMSLDKLEKLDKQIIEIGRKLDKE